MQLAAFNGSSRKNGNTRILLDIICEEVRKAGIGCEIISLSDFPLRGCLGCFACKGKARCTAIDDGFNDCFCQNACGRRHRAWLTRLFGGRLGSHEGFSGAAGVVCAQIPGAPAKPGVAVAAVRRAGGLAAVDSMNHFLLNKEMVLAGSTYWNMAYGKEPGDVRRDEEGMRNMRNLGENLAWLMRRLA